MHLEKLVGYKKREDALLIVVADGVGLAESGPANALSLAQTPNIDALIASRLSTRLHAHGTYVGLSSDNDMGNSEVGHNTLGGGRIFDQGAKLVHQSFIGADSMPASAPIFQGKNWQEIERRGVGGATVHFLGLLSDGNIHSHQDHLHKLIERAGCAGVKNVRIHILLDGRDVPPRSALGYVSQLQTRLDAVNQRSGFHYAIASGGGRMSITMDRYGADWEMVRNGYWVHILGCAGEFGREVADVSLEIQRQYEQNPALTDQYLKPFVVVDEASQAIGAVQDGDAVVLFNFRGDRAIEICQALEADEQDGGEKFVGFERPPLADIYFCGMLQYDGDLNIPKNYLVAPPVIDRSMVEFMCAQGLFSFAVAETQKFGHVTYFWNGNRSGFIDENLETYIEIPSDNCEFDQKPEMQACEITDATLQLLESGKYQFGRINFANGDMVGHSGNIAATVRSLECVDRCMGRLMKWCDDYGGILIFTADHGNADEMFVVNKSGERIVKTSHTLNPVPFVIYDSGGDSGHDSGHDHEHDSEACDYAMNSDIDGGLANVAATVFNLMGYKAPADYAPSLIRFNDGRATGGNQKIGGDS